MPSSSFLKRKGKSVWAEVSVLATPEPASGEAEDGSDGETPVESE